MLFDTIPLVPFITFSIILGAILIVTLSALLFLKKEWRKKVILAAILVTLETEIPCAIWGLFFYDPYELMIITTYDENGNKDQLFIGEYVILSLGNCNEKVLHFMNREKTHYDISFVEHRSIAIQRLK